MVCGADHYYLRMLTQASEIFLGRVWILENHKLQVGFDGTNHGKSIAREDRIGVGTTVVDIEVDDVFLSLLLSLRELGASIHEVGFLALGRGYYDRHIGATNAKHSPCSATHRMSPTEVFGWCGRNHDVALALSDVVDKMAGNRNLSLRLFAQRHTDGVANAIGKQSTNAHSALYSAIFALASLGDTKVERIVHVFFVHSLDEQTNRLHHDNGVRRLDGNNHVVEVVGFEDAQKFQAALHNTCRSVAISVAYAVGERTVVDAYAHGSMVLFADVDERHQAVFYLFQLMSIFLVGIFQFFELACRVDIVARVYSHLLAIFCCHVSHIGIEVDISHQRSIFAQGSDAGIDILHVLSLAGALSGETHQFATSLDDAHGLSHTCLGVVGVGGGHRLNSDRLATAHEQAADGYGVGVSALVLK